jgi:pSer/pThr/pTyr-binding forkhead associated (FHA) protein
MTLELRVMSGARTGARERFEKSVVSIGRHPLSDLRFDPQQDLDVSTRHAELRGVDGVWTLHDQQSTNGTFVNGERVDGSRTVRHGDQITFGANGPLVEVHVIDRGAHVVATNVGSRNAERESPAEVKPLGAPLPRTDPSAPAVAPAVRRDTTARIAEAVEAQTRTMRRTLMVGIGVLVVAGVTGAVWWQQQARARDQELLALIARNDSAAAAFERAVAEMRTRDPAFAQQLALKVAESRRALESGKALATAGGSETTVQQFSQKVREDTRVQQSLAAMDFSGVHDRNDAAVAMVASDLDGTYIAGTAFGVTTTGLLVTNRHVVRTAAGAPPRRIRVIFANTTDWIPAHLVRSDTEDDLALIQLDTPGEYPVVAGVSRNGAMARVGGAVLSIGYPHAVDVPMKGSGLQVTAATTTTAGTVSKRLDDVLQIDSYAGKGSSGSPVFDAQANVVGVVFGGAAESNGRIVYAVPAERVAAFLGQDGASILR